MHFRGIELDVLMYGEVAEAAEGLVVPRGQRPSVADDLEAQKRRGSLEIDPVETLRTERPLEIGPERICGLFRRQYREVDVSGRGILGPSDPNR